jgi:hypothetical protein
MLRCRPGIPRPKQRFLDGPTHAAGVRWRNRSKPLRTRFCNRVIHLRVPDAVQREAKRNGAPPIRDRSGLRVRNGPGSAPQHYVLRCRPGTRPGFVGETGQSRLVSMTATGIPRLRCTAMRCTARGTKGNPARSGRFSTAAAPRVKLPQMRLWMRLLPPLSESSDSSMTSTACAGVCRQTPSGYSPLRK